MGKHHNIKDRAGPVAPPAPWVEQATRLFRPATGRTERRGAPISASRAGLHVARASRLRIPAPSPRQEPSRRNPVSSPKNIKKPRNNTFYALNHTSCSGLRLTETNRSARVVTSHPAAICVPSVPLDTANSSKIPQITLFAPHPAGMPACSRWLSGAIPPDPNAANSPAPRPGCQPHQYPPIRTAGACRRNPKSIKKPRNNTFLHHETAHPETFERTGVRAAIGIRDSRVFRCRHHPNSC